MGRNKEEDGEKSMKIKATLVLIIVLLVFLPKSANSNSPSWRKRVEANLGTIETEGDFTIQGEEWNISRAIEYIVYHQRVDGGFAEPGYVSLLNYTAMSIIVLGWLGELDNIDLDDAISFIMLCYDDTLGGFGPVAYPEYIDLLSTWYGIKVLSYLGRLDLIDPEAVKNYVTNIETTTLVDMALCVDILCMLGYEDLIDVEGLMDYLFTEPPDGVNYGGVGFLNTPRDLHPTVISTWAGIKIHYLVGQYLYDKARVADFIVAAQNTDGGFRLSEYDKGPSSIEYTYFAVSALAMLGYLNKGNMGFAALYSVITANNASKLRDVLYALLTLRELRNVMIPLELTIGPLEVREGEEINCNMTLVNVYGEEITGATATVSIDEKTIIFFEQNGTYQAKIDTREMPNGTYTMRIEASKEPYILFRHSVNITVFRPLFIDEIYYNKTARTGEKVRIYIRIVDAEWKGVSGAHVEVYLQGKKMVLEDVGGGVYVGEIVAWMGEKNATMIIVAKKEGYAELTEKFYIEILPPKIGPSPMIIPKIVAYAIMIFTILIVGRAAMEDILICYGLLLVFIALAEMGGLLVVATDIVLLIVSSLAIFSVGIRRRKNVFVALGVMIMLVGVLGVLFGPATYMLAASMFVTAAIAIVVSPGEREIVIRDLIKGIVGWFMSLIAFSLGFMMLENPFSTGGLAPPMGIGISLAGYLALLWYCVFVFTPIITASKFAYIIATGIRAKIITLYQRVVGEEIPEERVESIEETEEMEI